MRFPFFQKAVPPIAPPDRRPYRHPDFSGYFWTCVQCGRLCRADMFYCSFACVVAMYSSHGYDERDAQGEALRYWMGVVA